MHISIPACGWTKVKKKTGHTAALGYKIKSFAGWHFDTGANRAYIPPNEKGHLACAQIAGRN